MEASPTPLGHGALYINIARSPELGLFRRFTAHWAKKVHDDTCQFLESLDIVNREIAALPELEVGSILDCPLRYANETCPKGPDRYKALYLAWEKYDKCLLDYGEPVAHSVCSKLTALGGTLLMSEQVMKLPCQHPYYTCHLDEFKMPIFKDFFKDGRCVLTGGKATSYQDLKERHDTCAWESLVKTDFLTMRFVWSSKWIEKNILSRLRSLFQKKKLRGPRIQTDIRYGRIVGVMDTIACLVASILLLVSVLALAWIKTLGTSLALVGVFGTLFALALKLIGGDISRGEMFAATAAFYAVEVVFIGAITATTTAACVCR
jgi:hypothetical protein